MDICIEWDKQTVERSFFYIISITEVLRYGRYCAKCTDIMANNEDMVLVLLELTKNRGNQRLNKWQEYFIANMINAMKKYRILLEYVIKRIKADSGQKNLSWESYMWVECCRLDQAEGHPLGNERGVLDCLEHGNQGRVITDNAGNTMLKILGFEWRALRTFALF